MRKLLFLLIVAMTAVGCTESFEDRCRREAKEYSERECPRMVDTFIIWTVWLSRASLQG